MKVFPLLLAELEGIFMHTLSRLQSQGVEEGESSSLIGRYLLLSSSGDQLSTGAELDTLKTLFSETLDILDTEVRLLKFTEHFNIWNEIQYRYCLNPYLSIIEEVPE